MKSTGHQGLNWLERMSRHNYICLSGHAKLSGDTLFEDIGNNVNVVLLIQDGVEHGLCVVMFPLFDVL